jgi:hypothetical protein
MANRTVNVTIHRISPDHAWVFLNNEPHGYPITLTKQPDGRISIQDTRGGPVYTGATLPRAVRAMVEAADMTPDRISLITGPPD